MTEWPDIRISISKPDLFEAFKIQLKKDFDNCGVNPDFMGKMIPEFDFILKLLSEEIKKIIKNSNEKLRELLYRIDINELQIKKLSQQNPEASFEVIIAELIIKRELQKVVIKQFYKNNE